jgi:Uri superfamily endonuclease
LKGIYALVINLSDDAFLKVGALGETRFEKGTYVYVGSAQTSLELRVKRHLKREKKLFWHIDYLLHNSAATVERVFVMAGGKEVECVVAEKLWKFGKQVAGFGCSDCNCNSHLFMVDNYNCLLEFMHELEIGD